ncbi:hypothetical protein ACHAPI_009377 [Fusarium lateritium]
MPSISQHLVQSSPAFASPAPLDQPFDEEMPEDGRPAQQQLGDDERGTSFDANSNIPDAEGMGLPPIDLTGGGSEDPREELAVARIGKRTSGEFAGSVDQFDNPGKARQQIANSQWLADDVIESMNYPIVQFEKAQTTSEAVDRIDIDEHFVQWYDLLPRQNSLAEAKRLTSWFERDVEPVTFEHLPGPLQPDTNSCGVFVPISTLQWLQGNALPFSFETSNGFLLSLLHSETAESTRSSPRSPAPKRIREAQADFTTAPTTLEEMQQCLERMTVSLRAQLQAEPRKSQGSLSDVVEIKEKEHSTLEADLEGLPALIQKVCACLSTSEYLAGLQQDAPGPKMEDDH